MNQIYNVIYVMSEANDFQNPTVDTKSFDTMERAEKYLANQYEIMKNDLEDGCMEMIDCANYGNNAEILRGFDGIVEVKHSWRIYTDTVNFEGI